MSKSFNTFSEFYPFYLSQHANRYCRLLHFVGTALIVVVLILVALDFVNWRYLFAIPLLGYGFAWAGHFFLENNHPATFNYPFYSLLGDWVMFFDILRGKIKW